MKLVRYGAKGKERPGLIDRSGKLRDLSAVINDLDGSNLSPDVLLRLAALPEEDLPFVPTPVRFGAPVATVGKIVAVGLNYLDHAVEANLPPPIEPVLFMKASSAIAGPDDDVTLPKGSQKADWEVELAVVIGTEARHVTAADALSYVAGYTICNDLSERSFQLERQGQWCKGKSCDGFAPLGPWLVTTDEIRDPQQLTLGLWLNEQVMQHGSTKSMIFSVADIIAYISQFMTLLPGDVVLTGTPAGVGFGKTPQIFLKPGDNLRLSINGLSEQRQLCKAWRA